MTGISCPKCGKQFVGKSVGTHSVKCGLTAADLFFQKVNKDGPGGCWIWTAAIKPFNGYGHFRPNYRDYNAHRWSYEHRHGPIPAGMEVAHRCDVPACVNPEHLFLASHLENMQDCAKKMRNKYGESNWHAKLNEGQVKEIRRRFTGKRGEISDFAREYGVEETTMRQVVRNVTWRHLL